MASPQTKDGYTKIANELLDALCQLHLSGNEWSFVHALIRKTYGYNKKEDWVTNTQIADLTGLHRVRVSEAKGKLLEKGIVTEKRNKISLVKDYEQWKVVTEKRNSVTEKRNSVTEKRNKVLRKSVPTKDKKDNITKDTSNQGLQLNNFMQNSNEKQIPEVIKLMEPVDPKNKTYYGNKTQRAACLFLLEEYGLVEIEKRTTILPKTNGIPFFPNITTPCQLRDKWVMLENAVKRKRAEVEEKKPKVIF